MAHLYTRFARTFGTVLETILLRENPVTGEEYEVELTVCGRVNGYVPARISGPPEDCYPAEGGYVEDVTAFFCRHGAWTEYDLTDAEVESLSTALYEEAESEEPDFDEPDYDDGPDYDLYDRY